MIDKKTNKQLTPKEKTIYVYHSSDYEQVVVLGRIKDATFASHIIFERYSKPGQVLKDAIKACMNGLSVFIETNKYPQDLDMTKYIPKERIFPVKERVDQEFFLAATTKHDK